MAVSLSTIGPAVKEHVEGLVKSLDSNASPLRSMVPGIRPPSDDAVNWRALYTGNTSTTSYSEGDAASAAGNILVASPTIAKSTSGVYKRTIRQITGHARDSALNGHYNHIMEDGENALAEHIKDIEGFHVTTLEAAADSGGSYAGVTRATVNFDSYEAAVGTLALSDLVTLYNTLVAEPIGMDPSKMVFLSEITFLDAYLAVAAGNSSSLPIVQQASDSIIDGGKFKFEAQYNGRPWKLISSMTSTVLLVLQLDLLRRTVWRPIEVEVKASVDDSVSIHITSAELMWYKNPRLAGKLT